MNNGTYGNIRLANVDINDISIFYVYNKNNYTETTSVAKELTASDVLTNIKDENGDILDGLYNLKLPESKFSELGIYNIIIKPKTYKTKILDVGTLSSRSDIRGVVLDINVEGLSNMKNKLINGGLDGFKIEYYQDNKKINNIFRIVTSSNKCEVVNDITSTNQKNVRYRFNDYSNLMFLTLTPSSNSDAKINNDVFIGDVGGTIELSNTYFDPIMLEVEIVDTTLETLRHGIYGNQVETRDGRLIVYTDDEESLPFAEYNIYAIKDEYDKSKAKFKEKVSTSSGESFDDTKNNLEE